MAKLKEDFETSGGEFKNWKVGDLFVLKSNPQLDKDNFVFSENAKYPYFTRTVFNNGIFGQVDFFDDEHLIKGNSIAVGMMGMQFFYMGKDFYAGQFTKTAYPKFENFNENVALYFISLLNKFQKKYLGVLVRDFEKTFYNTQIRIPVFNKLPAYDYMAQYISLLEEEKMLQVDKFLKDSGLNDTTLTAEESTALEKFRKGEVKFEERKIGELFEKIKVNSLKYKVKELEGKCDEVFSLPALTAGIENQGLSCFVPRSNATILKNVISVSANGANTGVMFYQPNDFTVLQDSYAIKHVNKQETSKSEYMFFVAVLQKTIRGNFTWSEKAGWERIKTENISVPITTNGDIDYAYMETFIKAQEKLVIKGVVLYADKKIAATKQTVGKIPCEYLISESNIPLAAEPCN